jgi:hypothetical protein
MLTRLLAGHGCDILFAPSSPLNRDHGGGLEYLSIDYSITDLSDPEARAKIDGSRR